MNDKPTLSKARGLNSIADPSAFKGAAGRRRSGRSIDDERDRADGAELAGPSDVAHSSDDASSAPATAVPDAPATSLAAPPHGRIDGDVGHGPLLDDEAAVIDRPRSDAPHRSPAPEATERSWGDPGESTSAGWASSGASDAPPPTGVRSPAPPASAEPPPAPSQAPRRAVAPGINRKRRELSVPLPVAAAVERTGINPADLLMSGYRRHRDAIYAGDGGRLAARGRTRLRVSISDQEFDQITRLGVARGWNRSETVSVILAMELLPTGDATRPGHA